MYARKIGKVERTPKKSTSPPSDQLRIGVTFPRPDGGPGPTKFDAPLSTATVQRFVPDPLEMDRALYSLAKLGFKVTQRGRLTASMRGSRGLFEKVFGTKLSPIALDTSENYAFHSFYYPPQGAPWSPSPEVATLIDDAYIQWPHIYMRSAGARRHQASAPQPAPAVTVVPSGTPPTVNFFHLLASDYASAFDSKIYSGRHVPDFCGLVGMLPHANYIMLPIPPGCQIDTEVSQPDDGTAGDGTQTNDGWGVFSGTSAAAPQLAGVCALLLEKNPGLKPSEIKAILRRTSRDVLEGSSNPASDDNGVAQQAGPGDDGATGAGFVDAFTAFQQA